MAALEKETMITITAIIRVRKGHEQIMSKALLDVADHVRKNEPGTVGFFVSQDNEDPCVFTTYERFVGFGYDGHSQQFGCPLRAFLASPNPFSMATSS